MIEKSEDFDLNLEVQGSTANSEKLKTYKDLCNIASELGHTELIYQFLHIHRHLQKYQNMKKAAKSLQLIMEEGYSGVKEDMTNLAPKLILF